MKKRPQKLKLPGKFDPQTRWAIGYFLVMLLVLWGQFQVEEQGALNSGGGGSYIWLLLPKTAPPSQEKSVTPAFGHPVKK